MKKILELIKLHKIFVIVSIIFLMVLSIIQFSQNKKNKSFDSITMDSGWTVNYNGKVYDNITLSEFKFDMANRGDELIFTRVLPKEEISHPILVNKIYHVATTVFVDDKVIYEYGNDIYEQKKNIDNTLSHIELPEDYAGKKLKIRLLISENRAFSGVPAFRICNETQFATLIIASNSIGVYIGLFTLAFGVIIIIYILIAGWAMGNFIRLFWIALICISFGLWSCCFYSIIQLFIHNGIASVYIEYLSLFFIAPSLLMFFFCTVSDRRLRIVIKALGILFAIVITTSIICNILDFAHFCAFHNYILFLSMISILITIGVIFRDYEKKKKSEKIMSQGLFILATVGGVMIIRYIVFKYICGAEIEVSAFSVTALLFIIIMLASYLEYIREGMQSDAKQNVLRRLAYTDTLTDIANRAMCNKYIENLEFSKKESIAVVYFDLNNLKVINDTMGHLRGDNYIREFAKLLEKYVGDIGFIGRMGGDEFIAIIKGKEISVVEGALDEMVVAANEIVNPNMGLKLSFAFGIAHNKVDNTDEIEVLQNLADKRMYDKKRLQKEKK